MSTADMASKRQTPKGLTGTHVLMMILGFFGVVFAVNGAFLYSALSTYTGVVSVEPYVKGLKYNDRIAADERQTRLGWTTSLEAGMDGRIVISVSGEDKRPLDHLTVTASLGRPSTNRLDRQLALSAIGDGRYAVDAGRLEAGAWLVSAEIRSKDYGPDPVYRLRRRVWLKP